MGGRQFCECGRRVTFVRAAVHKKSSRAVRCGRMGGNKTHTTCAQCAAKERDAEWAKRRRAVERKVVSVRCFCSLCGADGEAAPTLFESTAATVEMRGWSFVGGQLACSFCTFIGDANEEEVAA